jgi:hypothetical protein
VELGLASGALVLFSPMLVGSAKLAQQRFFTVRRQPIRPINALERSDARGRVRLPEGSTMAQVRIKRAIDWVPGGMMVVPLLIGAMFATFAPGTGDYFGSFTGALFKGSLLILAVFYVCMGSTIDIRSTPYVLKKGGALFATKIGMGILAGVVLGRLLGEAPVTAGLFRRAVYPGGRRRDE